MRRLDWPERLASAIDEAREKRYSATYYCAVFAADCVLAMTDEDPMADFRGLSREEAEVKLQSMGKTLYQIVEEMFGKPCPIAFAQRGDLVFRSDQTLGICIGANAAYISSEGGLAFHPVREAEFAFHV